MAAVEVTLSGVLYDKLSRTVRPVVFIGEASLTGLEVGGGPIMPPPFDPNAPRPSHPIAKPGDPWWGSDLRPSHPIALPGDPWWPKPPIDPPDPPTAVKPPPDDGGWGYFPEYGWGYFPEAGTPGPKKK